jgi:hypothetical protein
VNGDDGRIICTEDEPVDVIGKDPLGENLTDLAGLNELIRGVVSLPAGVRAAHGAMMLFGSGVRAARDSSIPGFSCSSKLSPAAGGELTGGGIIGGSIGLRTTPNRAELTLVFGLGIGLGGNVVAGLSGGSSEGFGLGGSAAVAFTGVGLSGLADVNFVPGGGPNNRGGGFVGGGVGAGAGVSGGITFTISVFDKCR